MTTIYLIRHGQSAANAGQTTSDPATIPLTELGRRQAQRLVSLMHAQPSCIVASHYVRAQDTARPLATQHGLVVQEQRSLHEFVLLSPRAVAGTDVATRKPWVDAFWSAADPGARHGDDAETFLEFATRVHDFKTALTQHTHNTFVVGHGIWFAMLIWQLQGFDFRDARSMRAFRQFQLAYPMPNAGIYRLDNVGGSCWGVQFQDALYQRINEPAETEKGLTADQTGT